MPKLSPPPAERARRKTLWTELNQLILHSGGWIVSSPNYWPVRAQFLDWSHIPDALFESGWRVEDIGDAEVFVPVPEVVKQVGNITTMTNQALVPMTVRVYRIALPS